MRCICCNVLLSDKEATKKNTKTGEYLDMCSACLGAVLEQVKIPLDAPEDDEFVLLAELDIASGIDPDELYFEE